MARASGPRHDYRRCGPVIADAGAPGRGHLSAALGRRRADLAGRPDDCVHGHQQRSARPPVFAGLADGRGDGHAAAGSAATSDTASEPHFSPDGKRLAYFGRIAAGSGLIVANADGSSPRGDRAGRRHESSAAVVGRSPRVVARTAVSSRSSRATPGPEADANGDPMVITRYLYKPTASEGGTRANDNRRLHIFVADVASKAVRQLTDGNYYEHSIDWSPKGDEILFVSNRGPDPDRFFNYDVFAVKVASGSRAPPHRHEERRVLSQVVARRTLRRVQRHEAAAHLLGNDDGGHARVGDGCRRHRAGARSARSTTGRARRSGRATASTSTSRCRSAGRCG